MSWNTTSTCRRLLIAARRNNVLGPMTKKVWYAVSRKGQGRIFTSCPVRNETFGIFEGESIGCISTLFMLFEGDGFRLPRRKFEDDPIELEISIRVK